MIFFKKIHCEKCDICITMEYKNKHKCVKGGMKKDCSICMEDMHKSIFPL